MTIHLSRQFRAEHEFCQHMMNVLRRCVGVTLFDFAYRQCFDSFFQSIYNGKFFPRGQCVEKELRFRFGRKP